MSNALPPKQPSKRLKLSRFALLCLFGIATTAFTAWAFGALRFDFPYFKSISPWAFLVLIIGIVLLTRSLWKALALTALACSLVLAWWSTQTPRNDRPWQPDVAQLAWAEINGDDITLHNVRNCDYRSPTDFTPHWETRSVRLSQLTGVDMFINYWGSPWMAHPIVSFQFADAPPICFSIETRKEVGEKYSAIGGLYRQYELTYIAADERDAVRLRTNYRKGEESYLYRTKISPERARERFMEYLANLNQMRDQPRWYNAITTNCTTAIRSQHPKAERLPFDWRLLVNGKGDEMLYERKMIATDDLPFPELRTRALINPAAQAADQSPDFSQLIRQNRPGFPQN
jgi:hypothetical protein